MDKKFIFLNTSMSILLLCGGYLIGCNKTKKKIKYSGSLRIDESEKDEAPKLFLELRKDLNSVCNSNIIYLDVVKEDFLKRKKNNC